MVEALFVVAILVVLGSVIIMAIVNHMRSMEKTENDGYAKTLFIAAQNNLTMAEHEGYLGRTNFGYKDEKTTDASDIYYFRVDDQESGFNSENSVLDLMLPFGALDENVRSGCYVIRYQKSSGKVLDVFYWKATGRYAFNYESGDIYKLLDAVNADPENLRNYNGSVIGYYGGANAEKEPGARIEAPQLQVFNEERLYVRFTRTISGANEKINLAVRGESSGVVKQMLFLPESEYYNEAKGYYEVVLDDITNNDSTDTKRQHFNSVNDWEGEGSLKPGENIVIYAVAYNNAEYTNVAYSAEQKTNSLFADGSTSEAGRLPETVTITNIRHLENLDPMISGFGVKDEDTVNAVQTSDLSWNDFAKAINPEHPESVLVFNLSGHSSNIGSCGFEPLSQKYLLNYDGRNHSISDVLINANSAAGLFGNPQGVLNVSNLRLLDCAVAGKSAGTLAASLKGGKIRNVLVCQSKDAQENLHIGVNATEGYAGGLIGSMNGTNIEGCAAAVYVTSRDLDAGGLVGNAVSGSIVGCYSAGFTEGGDYYKPSEENSSVSVPIYSVTAAQNAGGLVGSSSADIDYCYSTCSVYGNVAGGLVGSAKTQAIKNSYCTGLVRGAETNGAFVGYLEYLNHDFANNYYFSIINYKMSAVGKRGPDGSTDGMLAFDENTVDYRSFVSTGAEGDERKAATPYDDTLVAYYQGSFNLKTVKQLGYSPAVVTGDPDTAALPDFVDTHYGDWPAPEILIVNVPDGSAMVSPSPENP